MSAEVYDWFASERGITRDTLDTFNVSVRSDGAVVLPYSEGEKVRKGIPSGEREFFFTPGLKPPLYSSHNSGTSDAFLVEGETDTMRLWQELGGAADVWGLSGINGWRDDMADAFVDADRVWVVLDNDKDYNVEARVDSAWRDIRSSLGPKAKRIRLPKDVKDVCEFFTTYDLDVLRLLCSHTPIGASRYRPLDLTADPPPVKWLVENMICLGDIHLLMGEPGLGKSWLTMSLALAVAKGEPTWLGRNVHEQGRVLYVDEENPEDLIFDRFRKLGMTGSDAQQIRYLNNQGIRLDRKADELVDEALEFAPTLIILDALRRIHTDDENSAGAMALLFNNGIRPLARDTGAAVVLIHHANKSDSNSSYKRSAGSGDITAGIDSGFDVRAAGINQLYVANFKSRRKQQGEVLHVKIHDTPEGGVEILGGREVEPAF